MKQINLTPAEIQNGQNRQEHAENLIIQLPQDHDGRNSWLFNYGKKVEARNLRSKGRFRLNPNYDAVCDTPLKEKPMHIKNMYKIHRLSAANNGRSHNTNKFYETHEDALAMVERCINQGSGDMVIYKAIEVVTLQHQPTVVIPVEDDFTLT